MTASSRHVALAGQRRHGRRRLPRNARRKTIALLAAGAAALAAQAAAAGDVKIGRQKAEDKCMVCHGLDGIAKVAEAPNIAGQNERYLVEQLDAFKAGARQNEMMSIVIKDLSPTDIDDLAAYYAAIEITVGKIPGE
jgi:cytochrome c553